MQTDQLVTQWYALFLDLWNQRYRLEQHPRDWLAEMWRNLGGDPLVADVPSVMVTALLLRARAGFVALDRATRDLGVFDDLSLAAQHDDARRLHNRWDAVFRTGTPITERPHLLRPAVVMSAVLMMIAIAPYRDGRLMVL